jgi:hypothetical protein
MLTRDLFEAVKVRGWRRNGGVSINAGGFRHYIHSTSKWPDLPIFCSLQWGEMAYSTKA